jgi:ssDNA-binding Zn-finger/Zn-ribbon topoisomerase 1
MRRQEELGTCPNCSCALLLYKSQNYKRFVKCEICGYSYPIPKSGKIHNSAVECSKKDLPVLVIENPHQKAYFWVDGPCFSCVSYDKCSLIKDLIHEFTALKVYGY